MPDKKEEKKESSCTPMGSYHVVESNKIYITGLIDEGFYMDVIKPFQKITKEEAKKKNGKIYIYLDSPGGDLFAAFGLSSLIDQAKNKGVKIITIVLTEAHSAASLVAIQGDERYVSRFAMMIPHYPRGIDYSETPAQAENNKKRWDWLNKMVVEIYKKHTKLKDVEKKMEQNNFSIMGGADLIKQGFSDFLIEDSDIY